MAKRKKIEGFIVVSETLKVEKKVTGVVGLARPSRYQPTRRRVPESRRRWFEHEALNECFVHSAESLAKSLANGDDWTQKATHVFPAIYDKTKEGETGGGYADEIGEAITIEDFLRRTQPTRRVASAR